MNMIEVIGFIPAIIFPLATIAQLTHLLKTKSAEGVSATAWSAFAVGNVSLYIYTEKYSAIQSIVGLLFTAVLQLGIIYLIFKFRKLEQTKAS